MGAGVSFAEASSQHQRDRSSASSISTPSEGLPPCRDGIIPLNSLAPHINAFQHSETGEILILVDQHITKIGLIRDCSLWFEVQVSGVQAAYLRGLETRVSVGAGGSDSGAVSAGGSTSFSVVAAAHPSGLAFSGADPQAQSKDDGGGGGSSIHDWYAGEKLGLGAGREGARETYNTGPSLNGNNSNSNTSTGNGTGNGSAAPSHPALYYPPPRQFVADANPTCADAKGGDASYLRSSEEGDKDGAGSFSRGSERYDSCKVCGKLFDMTAGISREAVDHHVSRCAASRELRGKFKDIDHRLDHVSQPPSLLAVYHPSLLAVYEYNPRPKHILILYCTLLLCCCVVCV